MAINAETVNAVASLDISQEHAEETGSWGYWGLALGLVFITLGLLYGSYFFLLS